MGEFTERAGRSFNADERAEKRAQRAIIIGGKEFFPVRKTGKVMRELFELPTMAMPTVDEDGNDPDQAEVVKYMNLITDNVNAQLSLLLVEKSGKGEVHPEPDWLDETLDTEDARELLMFLMPTEEAGNSGRSR